MPASSSNPEQPARRREYSPGGPGGNRPVALIILDGWGHAPPGPANAISLAHIPFYRSLEQKYPRVLVEASGEAVGLPAGIMGNSEVGHLTLGTGRVNYQDLSRINRAVADGSFFQNPVLGPALVHAATIGASVHLMGLLSNGGVHSAIEHLHALVQLAHETGVGRLYIHCFMDGRDTSPTAGKGFLEDLEEFLAEESLGQVVTLAGRYYAMDRDKRWERVKLAYDALVYGEGLRAATPLEAITRSYEQGVTDEFVLPTVVSNDPDSRIKDGDTVIFFNFRPDRTRELTRAFIEPNFNGFERPGPAPRVNFIGMTEYDANFNIPIAFPDVPPELPLAEILSRVGLTQLHIAETEKYAHVTFFFNGGHEEPYPGETQVLIPSPRDIATYDERPQMAAYDVAERFVELYESETFDFVILNFANPDMVGHTGVLAAAIEALGHVDTCLASVLEALQARNAHIFITGDHGNVESMMNSDGTPNTAHTTNPVPLLYLEEGAVLREGAGLSDIAPTILTLLGIPVPAVMTGVSLVHNSVVTSTVEQP
ncbi:MAG: 2,3-bisphosphoglycerate-independent phosphoglycerate mutase [Actinobacteria bacterium]|nr:2,3-bisphosphoglycerate-independent phosphoglycerate mutase [Actinomycetota bacterium]